MLLVSIEKMVSRYEFGGKVSGSGTLRLYAFSQQRFNRLLFPVKEEKMKTNKALYPTIIILLIFISFILFIWMLQQNKSLYVQIEKAILNMRSSD